RVPRFAFQRSPRFLQILAGDDFVVDAGDNFLDHGALGLRAHGNAQAREKQWKNQPLAWSHKSCSGPVYRFDSKGSNTFLTLSATRPRRSRRNHNVPFGSSRNPSFWERINFTRFSGE